MEKKRYIVPAIEVNMAEAQGVIAVSFKSDEVDWKDDVTLEAKENSGNWDDIW